MVWDLDSLRRELHALGLDWTAATMLSDPGGGPNSNQSSIGSVRFNLDEDFKSLEIAEQVRLAIAAARDNEIGAARLRIAKAMSLGPRDAATCDQLARLVTLGPIPLRDPAKGVRLARQACDIEPANTSYQNTLGAALVLAGQPEEAIEVLVDEIPADLPVDQMYRYFFLARAYNLVGKHEDALRTLRRAEEIYNSHRSKLPDVSVEQLDAVAHESQLLVRPMIIRSRAT
jgi:tetratricopeptide (TPR) repeat protein